MKKKIAVIHGPNLNMLGIRDVKVYGTAALSEINNAIEERAALYGMTVGTFQSNSEGELIDEIHRLRNNADGIIINAGAYSHYSYAIMDALVCTELPCIDVHLSNIYAREEFRHKSILAQVSIGHICGFGTMSYLLAVDAMAAHLNEVNE
jgi:3-dehydroquinate dehydratase-2